MAEVLIALGWLVLGVTFGCWLRRPRESEREADKMGAAAYREYRAQRAALWRVDAWRAHCEAHAKAMEGSTVLTAPGGAPIECRDAPLS
jgi:hypothetical protein